MRRSLRPGAPVRRRAFAFCCVVFVAGCGSGVTDGAPSTTSPTHDAGADTVLVPPTTQPDAVPAGQDPASVLGADPALDGLAEACFDGDLFACDTLFFRSDVDTELEAYGQTCGGRVGAAAGAPGCAVRFDEPVPDAVAPGDLGGDPALDPLADACFTGDLTACDDLFLASSPESAYEAYGSTCGSRLRLGTAGGCQAQLGEL